MDKNIIGAQLRFGRFSLHCLAAGRPAYRQAGVFPTYGRQASSVPKSKENKATGIIADTPHST